MKVPSTSKEPKEKKKKMTFGRLVLIFFASIFIGFLGRIVTEVVTITLMPFADVLDSDWASFGSPYDIEKEYFESHFLGIKRVEWERDGVKPDGWLLKGLERWHKSAYERVIKKIPEDDLARTFFWLEYQFKPFHQRSVHTKVDVRPLLPELLEVLDLLASQETKIHRVDIKERFEYANEIIDTITDFVGYSELVMKEKTNEITRLLTNAEHLYQRLLRYKSMFASQATFDDFQLHEVSLLPFGSAYTLISLYTANIYYTKHCDERSYKGMIHIKKDLDHYYNILLNTPMESKLKEKFDWEVEHKYRIILRNMDLVIADYCTLNLNHK